MAEHFKKQHPLKKKLSKIGISLASTSQSLVNNDATRHSQEKPQYLKSQSNHKEVPSAYSIALESRNSIKILSVQRNKKKRQKLMNSSDKISESGVRSELLDSITSLEKQYDRLQYKRSLFTSRNPSEPKSVEKQKNEKINRNKNIGFFNMKGQDDLKFPSKSHFLLNKCVPKSKINLITDEQNLSPPPPERGLSDVCIPEGERYENHKNSQKSCPFTQSLQSSPYYYKQNLNRSVFLTNQINNNRSSLYDLQVISIGHASRSQKILQKYPNNNYTNNKKHYNKKKGIKVTTSSQDTFKNMMANNQKTNNRQPTNFLKIQNVLSHSYAYAN